ncbi:glycosyltransferase family 4 protein [Aggregatilinea lenta]|uniref:glycosyltransferase family 4 protein n=1 Tax=Aggregatilinea lenta TaxID=913108 RepID=UPI000E5A2543|nr:glycosyltransferase family 4 protein [Aggregatilinea lenta]
MRIAFLTPEIDPTYGWARYAHDLAAALTAQGVEVVAVTQRGARSGPEGVEIRDALPQLVPPVRFFLPRLLGSLPAARAAIQGCDLVHVVAEPYAPLGAWIAGKRPLVVTAHGTYVPQTVRRRGVGALYRRAYRHAHLIAVSDYTAGQVRAALPGADVTAIRNGVHFARFQSPAPAPDIRGPTILASGGVKPRKGTRLLVEALAQVRTVIPDARLVVTGRHDAAYADQIRARIAALGLDDAVDLPGQIPEEALLGWYQGADVFALPSLSVGDRFEGFGLVFLEASAAGLPVVGTRGSGVEEAVIEGETGLLVPQDDASALADAITRLLSDADLRTQMGAAGRRYAQTQDWSAVAERVRALYARCLP